jgi:predicted DNA binding CopG/RHH family protein
LGASKTKLISVRFPEEDIEAMKEIADATKRPYQQLLVIAVEQYIDKVASAIKKIRNKKAVGTAY